MNLEVEILKRHKKQSRKSTYKNKQNDRRRDGQSGRQIENHTQYLLKQTVFMFENSVVETKKEKLKIELNIYKENQAIYIEYRASTSR